MENVMVKTCLNHKIIKNSNLIQAMKNNGSPKATVIRRPNFSESRIFPKAKFVRIFAECSEVWIGGLNARHDNRLSDTYSIFSKAEFARIFTECSEVWIEHTTW